MQNIDWDTLYSAGLYIIKMYPMKIFTNVLFAIIVSLLISFVYLYFFRKFKGFFRENKWYRRSVKLYIPLVIIVNLLFAAKFGLIRGIYKGLEKDSYSICKQVYDTGSQQFFANDTEKQKTLLAVQSMAKELSESNKDLKVNIVDFAKSYNTKVGVVDKPKNWIAAKFADKYGDRIHTLALYGMLSAVPHANVSETMSYEDFHAVITQLLQMNPQDIEKSIISKIQVFFLDLLKSQYSSIIKGILLIWALLILIPWAELFIYKYVMKRKLNQQNSNLNS